jgi:hypothetical protein
VTQRLRKLVSSLALALLVALPAHADPALSVRSIGVNWVGRVPLLSFSANDFVNASVADKLGSGLPQRVLTRVYAYPEGGEQPIAVAALSCRVVYDLWEGVYRLQLQSETHDRSLTVPDLAGVVRGCLDIRSLALGDAEAFSRLRGQHIYFAALIELNPLSPDTVQRIRRWLSKSGGGQLRGDAFFGSFVSIFVSRRMGSAEYSLTFRSATVSVPP